MPPTPPAPPEPAVPPAPPVPEQPESGVHEFWLSVAEQTSHELAGFVAPFTRHAPLMKHESVVSVCVHAPAWQASVVHTRVSDVHPVPSTFSVQALELAMLLQRKHGADGFVALSA
jgi:hypothetical protein